MAVNEHIVIQTLVDSDDPGQWNPIVGSEGIRFRDKVPADSREQVEESAISVLRRGINPSDGTGRKTGLVIGYVQSGKTMSIAAVCALARDNGYRLVIVIAGMSNPLLAQTTTRLREDLTVGAPHLPRRWSAFKNPPNDRDTSEAIHNRLADWHDPALSSHDKSTVLITVLKNHHHLGKLVQLIGKLDMGGCPALIIDDEADQASLNRDLQARRGSTIYRHLVALRKALPLHTYLQYTATPQAPLLISIVDALSPEFVEVLEPGASYVGGKGFFGPGSQLCRVIPEEDVPSREAPLEEPPRSLLEALRVFLTGLTSHLSIHGTVGKRSMLIHPSHLKEIHHDFCAWVRRILNNWKQILDSPSDDIDRSELLEDFRSAHRDLYKTAGEDLCAWPTLVRVLPRAIRDTMIIEINTRDNKPTPKVPWEHSTGWILVAGQAVDRGFTVEGLTVTYMPRGIGTGNADAIQQRARFLGYKKPYIGHCRVYLEESTLNALGSYVDHEEDIRDQMAAWSRTGLPLRAWMRVLVLDNALKPCRRDVLRFGYTRADLREEWVVPKVIGAPAEVYQSNREVVCSFGDSFAWQEISETAARTKAQRHWISPELFLSDVIENLLIGVETTGSTDLIRHTGMLLQLKRAVDGQPNERCMVYRISPGASRTRTLKSSGEVTELFQGRSPKWKPELGNQAYPGDRAYCDGEWVSVQIHMLTLRKRGGGTVASDVPVVAVHVPERLRKQLLFQVQEEGNGDEWST